MSSYISKQTFRLVENEYFIFYLFCVLMMLVNILIQWESWRLEMDDKTKKQITTIMGFIKKEEFSKALEEA